jgi:hypothetical protein
MRGLYWLTAITLVAAAVTTVAIADYSRRHPGPILSGLRGDTVPKPVMTLMTPSEETPPPIYVGVVDDKPATPSCPSSCASPMPVTPPEPVQLTLDQVLEHKELKASAMNKLTMMQEQPLPSQPIRMAGNGACSTFAEAFAQLQQPPTPVRDEFTFPGKDTPTTPTTPFASKDPSSTFGTAPTFKPDFKPDFKVDSRPGAEVLPGLHAVKVEEPACDKPVAEALAMTAEVISLLTPQTYLQFLPPVPTKTKPQRVEEYEDDCQDKKCCQQTCQQTTPAVPVTGKVCCTMPAATATTCCSEERVVRTYSVAEFSHASTNCQDLIKLITNMIAPDSWETKNSNIAYFAQGKCLVIRHKSSVHKELEELLGQLRAAVQKQTPGKMTFAPPPIIRMEPTCTMPPNPELVPLPPLEGPLCLPRVITNEPPCRGDDEFFGMIPSRFDGRLLPVPTRMDLNPLLPASFVPSLEDGPVTRANEKRMPDFFPLTLPYAPLPLGPDLSEEERAKVVELQKTSLGGASKPEKK